MAADPQLQREIQSRCYRHVTRVRYADLVSRLRDRRKFLGTEAGVRLMKS